MNIRVKVVTSGKKAKAYVVVSPLATTGNPGHLVVVKPTIEFLVDGTKTIMADTNENGRVDIELGNDFKSGPHAVEATVFGQTPTVSTTENFTTGPAAKKPTGAFGRFMMVLFWVLMILVSWGADTLPVLLVYLAVTAGVLAGIAKIKGTPFQTLLGNNDWVFWANGAMLFVSMMMAFVGESWMWSDTALLHTIALIPSLFVSFTDETKELVADQIKKHGVGGFLKHAISWEILTELLKIPFKLGK